ncbi:S1C family serine protease [Ligilactobacillus salivarius]|uniref:Serine protease n=1 Tax=Ligilactobacillus salivarius TaxID=1624 RepID=A0A2U2MCB0_9LACO|nr:trypsin-like peptidase domain-containing protein [Ligilactobacillus salivarius]PWG54498.1 serine protease [Ligilactobacillus salivarius]
MGERGPIEGEFKELNSENNSSNNNNNNKFVKKVAIISLVAGLLGGGVAVGAYNWYESRNVTSNNSLGATKTSNIKVDVSSQTTKAFKSVKNAVVSVEAYSSSSATNSIDALFGNSAKGETTTSTSEGSGVIYKKTGNTAFIVTNNHVISGSNKIEIILASGKKVSATEVGHDAVSDLAVLKINAKDVKQVASFGDSDNIQVGETALAIGSPLGSQYATSLTEGIISAKKRTIDVTDSSGNATGQATVIQTDAAINPGNSGGPLINLAGQVIGINSMKLSSTGTSSYGSDSTSVEGMGFAIPSNEVVKIINQLVKNGKVSRPALGIAAVDLSNISSSDQSSVLKLPSNVTEGVVVASVESDSPVKNTDIKKYDVITKIDGKKVSDVATLKEVLYKHKLGDTISIEYYHEGNKKTADVKLTLEANDSNTTSASNEN